MDARRDREGMTKHTCDDERSLAHLTGEANGTLASEAVDGCRVFEALTTVLAKD